MLSIIRNEPMWFERYSAGWLVGGGALCLALWLLFAFVCSRTPGPRQQ